MVKKQLSLKRLSVPIFVEFFLRYLSIIINTIMVTQHSNFLVGAMGAGNQILGIFFTLFGFLSVGCSVVITQAIGAKNENLARKAIHQSLFLNALLGFIFGLLIITQSAFLLHLLNIPDELFRQSNIYLSLLGVCLFFDAVGIILAAIIRVYNLAYYVTFITLAMNFVSMGLNYLVLYHTNLELLGVGLSTIIGRVVAMGIFIFVLVFKLKIHLRLKEMLALEKSVIKKILSIGGYSAGENFLWVIQYTIALSFIAKLGKESLSVQTIYFQISMFVMLTGQAISIANEIIIGKLVGAKRLQIAYKHAFKALYLSLLATFVMVMMNFILQDFIMQSIDLLDELKVIMAPLFFLSIFLELSRTFNIVMVNSLRASADAKFPFYSGLVCMIGISLPVGYVLCFYAGLGIIGVWIGFLCDEFCRALANSYRWKSKKWQGKAVV